MIIKKRYLYSENKWNVKFEDDNQTISHYAESNVNENIDVFILRYSTKAQEALNNG